MAEAIYNTDSGTQAYTPGSAASAGEIVQLSDTRAAVVKTDLAASELGSVYTAGIFDVAAATGVTFAIGETVFWDASADTAINSEDTDLADFAIGTAVAAAIGWPGEDFIASDSPAAWAAPPENIARGAYLARAGKSARYVMLA